MTDENEPTKIVDENSKSTIQIVKKNFMDVVMNYKKIKRDEEKVKKK